MANLIEQIPYVWKKLLKKLFIIFIMIFSPHYVKMFLITGVIDILKEDSVFISKFMFFSSANVLSLSLWHTLELKYVQSFILSLIVSCKNDGMTIVQKQFCTITICQNSKVTMLLYGSFS
jgi:hypothetical protein